MKPDVPSLLRGVADALETDALGTVDDLHARRQLTSAIGILRRLATLVPHLHPLLLADADDIVATLRSVDALLDPPSRQRLDAAADALASLDARQATLDEIDVRHQELLALFDDVVTASRGRGEPALDAALRGLAARLVARERALGASIAGR